MLPATQINWDNQTLDYDLDRYNWPQWFLEVIREIEPSIAEFETIHERFTPSRITKILEYVQKACRRREFMERFDAFAEEYLAPRINGKRYLIQRNATMSLVLPNQAKIGRRLPWHQGVFVGNGRGMRKLWSPLTPARDSNTVWFINLEDSRWISRQVLENKWTLDQFEDECVKRAWPVNLNPGQSHLFLMEEMHGNVNNETGYTRASFDWGILVEGEEHNVRLPAGFYRFPRDYQQDYPCDPGTYIGKTVISYISTNNKYTRPIPKPLQRYSIEDYCQKHSIHHNGYQFENDWFDWLPTLEHFIKQRPDVIVLYSLYSLPDDKQRRDELLEMAINYGVELHFANEQSSMKNSNDFKRLKSYLDWPGDTKMSPYSWEE